MRRRLVITVCPRESGAVTLPARRGDPAQHIDAEAILEGLRALVRERQLEGYVSLREACAGGCGRDGPNVSVTIHAVPPPGKKPDHVAIGWKTYVYSLADLDCLATIVDENIEASH
jgi:hypothetical protein